MAAPAAPAVSVEHLRVRHGGGVLAVDDLSFKARAGQVTVLLGPNGAGKTTTVETLEGYRRPTGGQVRVLGLDPVADHRRLVRRMGVMLQGGGVYPGIRPLEALRLFAAHHGQPGARAGELADRLGLRPVAGRTWRQLSGGEQQRLSLALALVGRPEVLFLDEPTAGVDVGGRRVVREVMTELRDAGGAVVVTTHELDEAERLADVVVIIDHGRLVAAGPPAELAGAPGREVRFRAVAGLDTAALGRAVAAPVEEVDAGEYLVAASPTPAVVAAVTAWLAERDLPLADLRAGRQRLEDVFLRLTAGAGEGAEGEHAGRRP